MPSRTISLLGARHCLLSSLFVLVERTSLAAMVFDRFKLRMPVVGPVFRKVAISRFSRTLGTLLSSGVPILQALTIVKETAGNVVVGKAVAHVHDSVKEGETIAPPLKASGVFPAMVVGMVDVGEQTGALPEMLLKIADTYDDEVDNAVGGDDFVAGADHDRLPGRDRRRHRHRDVPAASFNFDPEPRRWMRRRGGQLSRTAIPAALESMMIVTGPSLVRLTSIWAAELARLIGLPKSCASLAANCSYSGTAISGRAARL